MPWGETAVVAGIWLALAAYIVPRALIGPTADAITGHGEFTDIGNVFEKAAAVARFADERLVRAAAGNALAEPPRILGFAGAARVAWVYAIVSAGLFATTAVAASRQTPAAFARRTGLDHLDVDRIWLPAAAVAAAYLAFGAYSRVVDSLGVDLLQPEPGVLDATLRDTPALLLYGLTTVVAAPIGEELFYRGLVFGGLGTWGFVPAALVSSALFALSHLDLALLPPFMVIGLVLSWLYWRSGSLWDAIGFHALFNLLSFILLVART